MIDIHTHILPNLDDGAKDWNESVNMAELSLESGVTTIVVTPHCGFPDQDLEGLRQRVQNQIQAFQNILQQARLPLEVLEGMEIFGTEDTPQLLRRGILTTLNNSRYPLIEFPFRDYGHSATEILDALRNMDLVPVIAHPERYLYVQRNPELLNIWTDMGCLMQVNRGSLLGRFGQVPEALAWAMLDRGFVCTVASDAHSPQVRTPWMRDVQEFLTAEFSKKLADSLLYQNPSKLLQNQTLSIPEPDWF